VLQLALTAGHRCDVGPKIGQHRSCNRAPGGLATSFTVGLAMQPAGLNYAFSGLSFLFVQFLAAKRLGNIGFNNARLVASKHV